MTMIGRFLVACFAAIFWSIFSVVKKALTLIAVLVITLVVIFGGNSLFRYAFADYLATVPVSGSNFASVGITVSALLAQYQAMLVCDAVLGKATCATVKAGSTQSVNGDTSLVVQLNPNSPGMISSVSNATSAVATSSVNAPVVSYCYGFNGTTWDQCQVDGSKNLKVAVNGTQSNASSAVATSSTNSATVSWMYIFNGTTWDQWQGTGGAANVRVTANTAIAIDPCQNPANTRLPFTISQAANAKLITGTTAKKTYICSIFYNGSDAENLSLVEGTTGGTCGSGTFAMIGATTAAAGNNFTAGSGVALGNGSFWIAQASNATGDDVCLFQSGTGRVAGNGTYVQQ